ncbi:MAG: tagatose 1,6-diphosphate aldolase [Elusimicrobia bacterium]|nr:tagatose 1,6-diphosphate aldolase [Elusimicrobiota bacterium]MDE2236514.1 tagatose 1,6-diphosphate aldolase [Elusimicrobiota bacterium]MDE2425356.1 tagatose 1,6-diphosphate aldolase [Elusimicrobiota bacterium]
MTATAVAPGTSLKDHFLHLTPGKLMGLRQITDENNRFKVFALDQSNSFKKALRAAAQNAGAPKEPAYEDIRDAKLVMVRALAAHASAVLLDVNFGARQAVNSFALPRGVGLIVRSEASRDAGLPSEYEPGWSVEKIKRMGASAVKLLVYLDTENKDNVKAQIGFVQRLSKECRANDILLMTEELSFPRKGEDKSSPSFKARKVKNILEATKLIGPHTDILKLEFPGDIRADSTQQLQDNLGKLNEAAIRPWVLLSAGEKFDFFIKQVELAMSAGCAGYMAGRAIFNEWFEQSGAAAKKAFLAGKGVERMKALNAVVNGHAQPWTKRYELTPETLAAAVDPHWYLDGAKPKAEGAPVKGDY